MKKFSNWNRILSCTVCSTVCHGLLLEIAVKHQHLKDNLTKCVTLFILLQWLLFSRDTTKISIKSKPHLKDIPGLSYFFSILSNKFSFLLLSIQQRAQKNTMCFTLPCTTATFLLRINTKFLLVTCLYYEGRPKLIRHKTLCNMS